MTGFELRFADRNEHASYQFFDRDRNVENDVPVVRHNRMEEILFVWTGLMLILIAILYQVWRA
jgi:hypothetical protein